MIVKYFTKPYHLAGMVIVDIFLAMRPKEDGLYYFFPRRIKMINKSSVPRKMFIEYYNERNEHVNSM